MINKEKYVRQAFYDALTGNISVEVFKEDVPADQKAPYVLIRIEGNADRSNNHGFNGMVVVLLETVASFKNAIDPDVVDSIDEEITTTAKPEPHSTLSLGGGLQMASMKPTQSNYVQEDDGVDRYHRKITRWECWVNQTNN